MSPAEAEIIRALEGITAQLDRIEERQIAVATRVGNIDRRQDQMADQVALLAVDHRKARFWDRALETWDQPGPDDVGPVVDGLAKLVAEYRG